MTYIKVFIPAYTRKNWGK